MAYSLWDILIREAFARRCWFISGGVPLKIRVSAGKDKTRSGWRFWQLWDHRNARFAVAAITADIFLR
jgi:hypothetical protein